MLYTKSYLRNQLMCPITYMTDWESPQTLNMISRVVLVYVTIVFLDRGLLLTVMIRNKPYAINKDVRMRSATPIDFDMIGLNDECWRTSRRRTSFSSFVKKLLFVIIFQLFCCFRFLNTDNLANTKTLCAYTKKMSECVISENANMKLWDLLHTSDQLCITKYLMPSIFINCLIIQFFSQIDAAMLTNITSY